MDTRDRVEQLLAERATEGLDADRAAELDRLLAAHPEWADDTFDLAAAAIDQALSGPPEAMPGELRDRLVATAAGFSATRSSSGGESRPGSPHTRAVSRPAPIDPGPTDPAERARRRGPRLATWGGWLAAAAALVLAALAWWPQAPQPAPESPEDPAAERAALLAGSADTFRIDWAATDDPAATGAEGDVVWSPSRQAGYMRIAGLETNDPSQRQYQLWVFDAERDERFPVDGGVFDVPAGAGEVVVPIRARLPVGQASLFAVTVEPPGGVVVSSRERIVLVAPVGD